MEGMVITTSRLGLWPEGPRTDRYGHAEYEFSYRVHRRNVIRRSENASRSLFRSVAREAHMQAGRACSPARPHMRALLTALIVWTGFHCSAQCPYDLNGDGQVTMGGGESLAVLADLGQDTLAVGSAVDFNNNGLVDILDVLDWGRHVGQNCPTTEIPETDDRILGLSLAVHHVHDTAVTEFYTIPEGFVTYRLYLQVTDNTDRITGVFGIDGSPLILSSTAPLWNNDFFGAHVASNVHPAWYLFSPTLQYDSWWSLGFTPEY